MRKLLLTVLAVVLLLPLPVYAAHVAGKRPEPAWFAIFAVMFLIGAALVATVRLSKK